MLAALNRQPLWLLMVLFLVTVLIRQPNLDRPLSKHHEFCTAVALRTLDVWEQEGIAASRGNPIANFPLAADKHINNYASASGQMVDKQGNYYYVSHPPLGYYVPWLFFKLTGQQPDVLPLQFFHMLFHFLCAWLVLLIVREYRGATGVAPLLAAVIYLFNPATLWFQSNTYMSDMFVQVFFAATLLAVARGLYRQQTAWVLAAALLAGLATYTSWLGVFVGITLVLVGLVGFRKHAVYRWLLAGSLLMQLAFLGLIAWQYSHIAGWEAYLAELTNRFDQRGIRALTSPFSAFSGIAFNYVVNYGPLLLLAPWGLWLMWRRRRFAILGISVLPVLLLHLVLPNYSGHDFTVLYAAIFLSLGAAATLAQFHEIQKPVSLGLLVLTLGVFVGQYYYVNRPREYSWKGDRYDTYQILGRHIHHLAPADAVVFVQGMPPNPEIIWYAHRNMKPVDSELEAEQFLQQVSHEKGILFLVSSTGEISEIKNLYLTKN